MNNYSEQEYLYRWAQEVLYLHSLWRQGPPNQNQTQNPYQNPNSTFRHLPPHDPAFYPRHSSSNPNPYFHPHPNPSRYCESRPKTQLTPGRSNVEQKRECETREDGKKRKGKMYRGCTALAQHACADHKLGWRAGHKAFARAICQVLGWDPQRLPTIVLLPGSVVIAGRSESPIPNSDIPDTRKRDPSDGSPGQTLEHKPVNYPSTAACPSPENVPGAGDSGTEKISKQKDSDQDEVSENYAKEDPKVIVRQNPISNSDSPERKGDTNNGLPGLTLEQEPANSPCISAYPPPEDVPDAGDSGTEKNSKEKDPDQEGISENYAKEYPEGIV